MAKIFNGEEEIEVSETNHIYLSDLSLNAANEIRNYVSKKSNELNATKELSDILKNYRIDKPNILSGKFPHYALYNAMNKDEGYCEEYSNMSSYPIFFDIFITFLDGIKKIPKEHLNKIADSLDDFSVTLNPSMGNFSFRTGK